MGDAHLALRHGARRIVEHERRLAGQRYADAAGIGAEARVASAVRCHARVRDHVHEMHRYQSFGHRHLGPLADATEMMRIAERHDGGIEYLPRPGKGARFVVRLPVEK